MMVPARGVTLTMQPISTSCAHPTGVMRLASNWRSLEEGQLGTHNESFMETSLQLAEGNKGFRRFK